ncbi:MAG TPA: hypothetical protein VHC18_02460 [Amycolatopsis sp.]|nr:hypothetical protein [Amycolatopsis sp.]
MGRHARDEDPVPRRTDRPSESRRPVTGGPPRQASGSRPVQPGQPRPTAQPGIPRPATQPYPPRPTDSFAPRPTDHFTPRPTDSSAPRPTDHFTPRRADSSAPRSTDHFPPRPAEPLPARPAEPAPPRSTDVAGSRFADAAPARITADPFPPRPAGELFRPGRPSGAHPADSTTAGSGRAAPRDSRRHVEAERARRSPGETTGSHRTVGETATGPRRVTDTGSTRIIGTGSPARVGETTEHRSRVSAGQTATGTHRAMGKVAGRRRIAKWPIVAGGFVVLLVVGLLGWGWANNVLNSRAEAQANGCADGDATMKVLVTPTVEKPVEAAAARWNQARTVVHAHCIHVDVTPMASDHALGALTGNVDSIGGMPAAWIAENSPWIGQLQTTKPAVIAAPAESVASAPSADYQFVGLTGTTLDEVQARAAQVFRDYLREPAQRADFAAAGLTSG